MKKIYLDNAATTPLDKRVVEAILPFYTEKFGNASSLHEKGREAHHALEDARKTIAKSINAQADEIIFTSGGTESNNFVLKGLAFLQEKNHTGKNHVITTKIEHPCILQSCKFLESKGFKVTYLNVDNEGFINPEELKSSITDKTFLVSVIHGNNEIGTIQNIAEIGKLCKENSVLFHTDACQSYTKTELNVKKQHLDLVTLNAHKIHGPKGVGVLYIKKGINILPLLDGGGQENKLRAGTENIPGIVGFAAAVKLADKKHIQHMTKIRDKFIEAILKIPNTRLNGAKGEKRLCNNTNFSFLGIEGEALGSILDAKGISTSTGSACSSLSLKPSHVLTALDLNDLETHGSLRITFSRFTTEEEIDYTIKEIESAVTKLRKISMFDKFINKITDKIK